MAGEEDKEAVETEARNLGWRPQEEWDGDPDRWVDADEFVEKGKHVIPILRENNKRLQKELLTRDQKIDMLQAGLKNSERAIEVLGKQFKEATAREVAAAKKELRQQLVEARESGDVDAELDVQEQIEELREEERKAKASPAPAPTPKSDSGKQDENLTPEFKAWQQENSWFGQDIPKTKAFIRMAEDMRDDGDTRTGADFFAAVEQRVNAKSKPAGGKVESGAHSGRTTGGKSFASLPKEAQEACLKFSDDLVGEGKAYKTMDEWKAQYTKDYLAGEE